MPESELLTHAQMKEFYGDFYLHNPRIPLNANNVPLVLHPLLPYAEFWGIADDCRREALVESAPIEVISNLRQVLAKFDDTLDDWLAGDEAESENPSTEYIVYSAMRMAADFA